MKKLILTFLLLALAVGIVKAVDCNGNSECMDLERQISELSREVAIRKEANERNADEARRLESKVKALRFQISQAEKDLNKLEEDLATREEAAAIQYKVLSIKTREFYKNLRGKSILSFLFSSLDAGQINRELAYRWQTQDQDRQIILQISREIIEIERDKINLEKRKNYLSGLSDQLEKEAKFLEGEVAGVSKYISNLEGKIAALSAKQQEVLGQKGGTFQTTVGDVPLADDPNSRPDYNPGFSPAFAAFSFGAPHFKGLSQYGAFGRAKAGQGVEEILRAYYGGGIEIKKDYSTSINITVTGYGTVDIETYTKRIYEMPGSWGDEGGMEALKAQAVAARSYALARTNNGAVPICATEACQVYKPYNKGGNWEKAVDATRGWVLQAGGKPFSAWYASTSGGYQESYTYNGYSTPAFWDTPSGRSGWTSEAYEKKGESPWFYKGWYKTRSGDSCGRSHPWLTGEELADVLNAWVVVVKNGVSDDRVLPLGGCWGGNPYSMSEMRDKANGLGGGYSRVTGVVRMEYSDNGYTQNVVLGTDRGEVTINGLEFKKAFNLRAPGRIALKSGLFNIEQK